MTVYAKAYMTVYAKAVSSHSDSDGKGSIPASPDALHVPLLLCQELFNEASLSDCMYHNLFYYA